MTQTQERIIVQLSEKEERELRTHDTYHGRRVSSWTMVMYVSAAGTQMELTFAPPPPKQAGRFELSPKQAGRFELSPKQAGRFEHIIRVLNMIEADEQKVIDGMAAGGWEALWGDRPVTTKQCLEFSRGAVK